MPILDPLPHRRKGESTDAYNARLREAMRRQQIAYNFRYGRSGQAKNRARERRQVMLAEHNNGERAARARKRFRLSTVLGWRLLPDTPRRSRRVVKDAHGALHDARTGRYVKGR